MPKHAVILDIDGTLSPEVSWTALTRELGGSVDEHLRIFNDYRDGAITYEESRVRLIGLWRATGQAGRSNFERIFDSFPLRPAALPLVERLKSSGYELCLITGSFDLYAQAVASKLGVGHYYANTPLYFDGQNTVSGYDYTLDQSGKKLAQFEQFCASKNLVPENCFAVGDGEGDLGIFRRTKRGILLKAEGQSDELHAAAWRTVSRLEAIPDTIAS